MPRFVTRGFYERMAQLELAQYGQNPQQQNMQQYTGAQIPGARIPQPQGNAQVSDPQMGDPNQVTDLTDALASMLRLDLSAATSPEQQNQLIYDAVNQLVLKLHELSGEEMPDDQMQDDQMQDGMQQDDMPPQDGEEDTDDPEADYQDGGGDEEVDDNEPTQRKRAVAAAFDDMPNFDSPAMQRAMNMARNGREQQIQSLCMSGHLTPHAAKLCTQKYCNEYSLSLSLSLDEEEADDFDDFVALTMANGPVVQMGERTGAQSKLSRMSGTGLLLDLEDDEKTTTANPLIANAEKRANGVKRN